jgi:hypothetical protein
VPSVSNNELNNGSNMLLSGASLPWQDTQVNIIGPVAQSLVSHNGNALLVFLNLVHLLPFCVVCNRKMTVANNKRIISSTT